MKITSFGVAVIEGDRLSGEVERAGRLACVDDWLQTFRAHIPAGGVVVDVGAALGDHTVSYAAMVGPTGEVHAFEPYQPFLECLQHNTSGWPTVEVHDFALSDNESWGRMVRSETQPHNLGMTHLVASIGGNVRVLTLDGIASDWTRIDFVKIDVEGSEPLVLDGAKETLKRFKPAILIEVNAWALNQKGFTPDDVYRRVRALGYACQPARPGQSLDSPEIDVLCTPSALPARHRPSGKPRVHLLSVPNTRTTDGYALDGFWNRTRLFAALLKRLGHEVVLYGVEENDTPCDAFVSCLSVAEQQGYIGATPYQHVPFESGSPLFLAFNARAASHIRGIKEHGDLIATIAGSAQQAVSEQNPELPFLEYSVGYRGVVAPYRVYQSHVWRHVVHGYTGIDGGRLCDGVIPPWFEPSEFPAASPEDYVLFCGRVVASKGIQTACAAAEAAGVRLVVIGHGDASLVTYGEYVGEVSTVERNRWLSRARAVLMPTQYIEPFGNVSAEAQLCGTPVISTDFGAFVESVEPGLSGYRCTTLGEWVEAIELARDLDRRDIRERAQVLYSTDAAAASYAAYFARLVRVREHGWRDLSPGLSLPERNIVVLGY